ncbi:MAG: ornithine carbamoyltransferase [Peptococcaceae bacterium]|nr:ornithine carbamoyltransferase [Peptococcaceae bacterium]
MDLKGRDLLSMRDLTGEEILAVLDLAAELKSKGRYEDDTCRNKTLAMIFQKPSTRTRISFELAIRQLGGHAIYLNTGDMQLGRGETVPDTARVLSRYVDGIMIRTFAQEAVETLARYASVPVINGLTDLEHPCQVLADFLTIRESKGRLSGLKLAWVGDGNNVAHSLMLGCTRVGMHIAVATPPGYEPDKGIVDDALQQARKTGARVELTTDPVAAVKDADVVVTDTWASMGQEDEHDVRAQVFGPYQVNADLVAHARDDYIFMHCLPAHRGEEVTDEIMDGPHSVVWDEAENRLHVQKAILSMIL